MSVAVDTALGARVRALRQRAGMSVAELARAAGVPEPALAALEGGERGLAVAELDALADALGVPAETLLTGEEPATPLFRNDGGDAEAAAAVAEMSAVIDDFFTFAAAVRG
jgi:transcriptional regulator with XRE-family HTH domain